MNHGVSREQNITLILTHLLATIKPCFTQSFFSYSFSIQSISWILKNSKKTLVCDNVFDLQNTL